MKVLVIGGTLFIGRLLVEELLKGGHEVAVLHRKPKHDFGRRVENLMADRNDAGVPARGAVGAALRSGFRQRLRLGARHHRGAGGSHRAGLAATASRRYIFLSSVAAYGDGLNHKESDPLAPDYHSVPYVRHKATTERLLFRMHAQTGLPVVTFRPPFVYGPGNPFYREQFFWDRLRAGRPIIIPGDGHRLMQFVYRDDLVHAMVRAMEEPRAVGEAFNVGDPQAGDAGGTGGETGEGGQRRSRPGAGAARPDRAGRRQRHGRAVLFRRVLDLPPITENIGKVDARAEDQARRRSRRV